MGLCCHSVAQSYPTLCDFKIVGFYRQEYWSGEPFPSPGDLPDPGIKPRSPTLQASICLNLRRQNLYHLSHQGRYSSSCSLFLGFLPRHTYSTTNWGQRSFTQLSLLSSRTLKTFHHHGGNVAQTTSGGAGVGGLLHPWVEARAQYHQLHLSRLSPDVWGMNGHVHNAVSILNSPEHSSLAPCPLPLVQFLNSKSQDYKTEKKNAFITTCSLCQRFKRMFWNTCDISFRNGHVCRYLLITPSGGYLFHLHFWL